MRLRRRRGAAWLIAISALWRSLTRRLCGVVRLGLRRAGRVGSRRSSCSGARQILLLATWLCVGLVLARRRKRLPVGAIHGWRLSDTAPDGMGWDKGLRLGGDGCEYAVLVEPHAIRAAAVLGGLEARATNLASPTVTAGNGGALARSWRLVVLLDILGRWRRALLAIVWWRRTASPLVGPREAIWLLVLGMLHVWSRLLRRRRERGVHVILGRIGAICRLL